MRLLHFMVAVACVCVVGAFSMGLALGRTWGRASAAATAHGELLDRQRAFEEELAALDRRLLRHAEAQRDLAERALDLRLGNADRHLGRRDALALGWPER